LNLRPAGQGENVIAALGRHLPQPGTSRSAGAVQVAALDVAAQPGLVLDYEGFSGPTNFTFKGDTTYLCTNTVNLYGATVLEGGAVIKLGTNVSAKIVCWDDLACRTAAYRPAVFTAKDDNSVGETISGSSGNPTNSFYGGIALDLTAVPYVTLSNLRFCYLNNALAGYGLTLRNTQLTQCKNGFGIVGESDLFVPRLYNVLIDRVHTFVPTESYGGDTVIAENVTAHHCGTFLADTTATVYLTNCLFVCVTNWEGWQTYTNTSAFLNSDTGIFQTVGAGALYLTNNSPYRDVGTTNINPDLLADLQHKTTHPPLLLTNTETNDVTLTPQAGRETDTPDLGYHYDPIDYITSLYTITNATLTLSNGVVIGNYHETGIWPQDGSQLISVGSPTALNRIVRYSTVQEQPVKLGASALNEAKPVYPYAYGSVKAAGMYRFTEFSTLANGGYHLHSYDGGWQYSNLVVRDCWFRNGKSLFQGNGDCRIAVTNNLFHRSVVTANSSLRFFFQNNLVRRGQFNAVNLSTNSWVLRDNSFDSCTISAYDPGDTSDHNAYINATNTLSNTNAADVFLTNFTYAAGPLGDYYHASTDLLDAGSTNADALGLYHYTTQTNQSKEVNSTVDIGFHYVAVNTNGLPFDTDADGNPDYLDSDSDGDGLPDDWELAHFGTLSEDGTGDYDGDWVSNADELAAETNPADTMVVAWGNNTAGQCNVPLGLRNATALAGGLYHSLVLQSNGVVTAWGDNSERQTEVPTELSNVVSIAASWYQSAALKAGGTVTNWGQTYGQIPANLTNACAIAVAGC
jgi:hypothetical protein